MKQPTNEQCELTGRAIVAAAYCLDASPHEITEDDAIVLAKWFRYATDRMFLLEQENKILSAKPPSPVPVTPELVKMGGAYVSCLMLINQLRKLAESHPRYLDKFNACVFCKNHIDRGHAEGCILVESQKAIANFDSPHTPEASQPPKDPK